MSNKLHPHESDYEKALEPRLAKVFGDLQSAFGLAPKPQRFWEDKFKHYFCQSDFLAVSIALHLKGKKPDWQIIQSHPALERFEAEECIKSAPSRVDAFAAIFEILEGEERPDHTVRREDGGVDFYCGSDLLVSFYPAPLSAPVEKSLLSRIESTFVGLEDSPEPRAEVEKRLQRWPALKGMGFEEPNEKLILGFPSTSNWLKSARRLYRDLKGVEATTAQAQELVALIFDQKSWNHLCALAPSDDKLSWFNFLPPVEVYRTRYLSDEQEVVDYHHYFRTFPEAFVDFMERVPAQRDAEPSSNLRIRSVSMFGPFSLLTGVPSQANVFSKEYWTKYNTGLNLHFLDCPYTRLYGCEMHQLFCNEVVDGEPESLADMFDRVRERVDELEDEDEPGYIH